MSTSITGTLPLDRLEQPLGCPISMADTLEHNGNIQPAIDTVNSMASRHITGLSQHVLLYGTAIDSDTNHAIRQAFG